ncbi:hypothetical protein NEIRO03_2367 [Nematocida sp. AWRm78]|nr:hypothetical protein NEIRO02_2256 [Nematocida sp. AWRm79]KAI5186730.1 hypothetical protein NEIRO03_2367 [Nematocida sp. AWRm78]
MGLNEQRLREGLDNIWLEKFSQTPNDEVCCKDQVIELIIEINNEEPIFMEMPEPLRNIANSGFFLQIALIRYSKDTKDIVLTKIKASINYAKSIIDIIIEISNTLPTNYKKEAFYKLLDNHYFFLNTAFIVKKKFFLKSIDELCEIYKIGPISKNISSRDLLYALMGPANCNTCSRLERVIEILKNHGDILIIKDQSGNKLSNIVNIGLNIEDVLILKAFRDIKIDDLNEIMNLVYRIIHVKIKAREKSNLTSLFNIYHPIKFMFTIPIDDILFILQYKEEIKNNLITVHEIESISLKYSETNKNGFETNFNLSYSRFEESIVLNHLKYIEDNLAIINNPHSYIRFIITKYICAVLNFFRNLPGKLVINSRRLRRFVIAFFITTFLIALTVINATILHMIDFNNRIPSILFT